MPSEFKIDQNIFETRTDEEIISLIQLSLGRAVLCCEFQECYNHADIAHNYLELAFIGEVLSSLGSKVALKTVKAKNHYGVTYQFKFTVESKDKSGQLVDILRRIMSECDDMSLLEPVDEFYDFVDSLNTQPTAFPELVDSYYANHLGSNYDWLDEYRDEVYSKNPEWAYHCWLSARSFDCGFPLYTSPKFWMLPAEADFRLALRLASDVEDCDARLKLVKDSLSYEGSLILLGQGEAGLICEQFHSQLLEVASIVFPVEYDPGDIYWSRLPSIKQYFFSMNNDFLVVEGETFTCIVFRGDFLFANRTLLEELRERFKQLYQTFGSQAGLSLEYSCNWAKIDDERFELICYDLMRRDGRFVPSKVRKMGLARSRDGGRDIVAYTHNRPGLPPEKWIVQCKLSLSKKSLGRNDVNLPDLVDEYVPSGVIIATNLIVDAGMYDKADRIAKSRGVEIEMWDGLEIERLVNRSLDLFQRYFK
jgi:hypothetical protein